MKHSDDIVGRVLTAASILVSGLEEEILVERIGAVLEPFVAGSDWVVFLAKDEHHLSEEAIRSSNLAGPDLYPAACRRFELGESDIDPNVFTSTLEVAGSRVGTLAVVLNDENRQLLSDLRSDRVFVTHMLQQIAAGIHGAKTVSLIRTMTVTDEVSGLYNSRFLHQALEKEHKRSERYGLSYGIIFLDLDHFKYVNDGHGHLMGTDVLRETADVISASLRDSDFATRYGGDEFIVILPETDRKETLVVANRILEALREHTFGRHHGLSINLTASLGVASYPQDATDRQELIAVSDQAMYVVKEICRNGIATPEGLVQGD